MGQQEKSKWQAGSELCQAQMEDNLKNEDNLKDKGILKNEYPQKLRQTLTFLKN